MFGMLIVPVVALAACAPAEEAPVDATATVAEACAKSASVESYDITSHIDYYEDGILKKARLDITVSGLNFHQKYYIGDEFIGESIRHENTSYSRDVGGEWYIVDVDYEGFEVPFPYSSESICPDLSGLSYMGSGQVNGVSVRHFGAGVSSAAAGDDENVVISVDKEGWMVQVEREPDGLISMREVFSGLGEPNAIAAPALGP